MIGPRNLSPTFTARGASDCQSATNEAIALLKVPLFSGTPLSLAQAASDLLIC